MSSEKKKVLLVAVAVVIIVALITIVALHEGSGTATNTSNSSSASVPQNTRSAVDSNVAVPQAGDQSVPANVAVPQVQAVASPTGGGSDYRSFSLNVNASGFTPSTVIVNQGDIIDLDVTAVGGNFDFSQPDYGFHVAIAAGQTKRIEFGASSSGKFIFYCSSCGGPAKGPTGYIEVVPPTVNVK